MTKQAATPAAPVQDDDAEWLRELAQTADEVEAPRFERIANRLTPDRVTPLVEALRKIAHKGPPFNNAEYLRGLARTALRDGGLDA